MKKVFYILLLFLLMGCQNNSSELLIETSTHNLKKEVKAFVDRIDKSNGIYLYSNVGEKQYFIINRKYVVQGEQASYIDTIRSEITNRTLVINLEEKYTSDYNDKKIGEIRVFEINKSADFDTIKIFINKKETPIDIVGT